MDYSPAEVSAADDFAEQSSRWQRGESSRGRTGVNDTVSLERKVDVAVEGFDKRLTALYARKIEVEKCVLTEELKIRLLDEKLSELEDLELEEKRIK